MSSNATRSGVTCVYSVHLFRLFSYIELCIFLCCSVMFVSTLVPKDWLGKLLSWCLSCRRVSPTKSRPDWRVINCIGFILCFVYSQHIALPTFSLFLFFNGSIIFEVYFVLKVPLNPNQLVNLRPPAIRLPLHMGLFQLTLVDWTYFLRVELRGWVGA